MRPLPVITLTALFISGCATLTSVDDLQAVFGPREVTFRKRELALDLNNDGKPERIIVFANKLRGLDLPQSASEFSEPGGVIVDGYSGTPLVKKLGIKDGFRAALVGAPVGFQNELIDLPGNVNFVTSTQDRLDFIMFFTKTRAELRLNFSRLAAKLAPTGMLWIAWPKRTSGVESDLSDNSVRDIGLEAGLVDVKVCAVNEIWSGLKFVIRVKDRPK